MNLAIFVELNLIQQSKNLKDIIIDMQENIEKPMELEEFKLRTLPTIKVNKFHSYSEYKNQNSSNSLSLFESFIKNKKKVLMQPTYIQETTENSLISSDSSEKIITPLILVKKTVEPNSNKQ